MKRFHFVTLIALALFTTLAPRPLAAASIPLTCNWAPTYSGGVGVFDDGAAEYKHGVGKVQCYFGVNARDVDMVTYNTTPPRTLHFVFDVSSRTDLANDRAALNDNLVAEVDLFGINYWGRFVDMANGSTAQVQMDLEFHDPNSSPPRTFELDYSALAAKRLDAKTWLITSIPSDICDSCFGTLGFTPSPLAKLNEIRRRGSIPYGEVQMPIRFTVTMK